MKVGTKTNLNILNSIVMLICPVLNGKHPFRARFLKKKKNFKTLWPLFIDGAQLPQGYSHFEEPVYFLPSGEFPEIPGTHFIDLGRMKGWVDLGAPSGFEHGTPGLGIQRLNH